jgi:hypothetical protein
VSPSDEGIKKNVNYTHNGILSFATTWMELEIILLSELSQAQKDKY